MVGDFLARWSVAAALAGDQNVEIADRFASPAQRTSRCDFLNARRCQQMLGQLFSQLLGRIDQKASANATIVLDRFQQFLFVLFAHARQGADFSLPCQLFHSLEVANLVGAPDEGNRLRAQSLNLEQLKHGGAIFLQQLNMDFDGAFLEEMLQIGEHAFADARHFQ